jgi:hypothetical protein
MKRLWLCVLVWLLPAPAIAQGPQNAPPPVESRLWIVVGAGSGTLRGHCQDCAADFPFRHGPAIVGNAGFRVTPRVDAGADVFWMQWRNDSGTIQAVAFNGISQFRPWVSKGFFIKGGAGMAFVRNWVTTTGNSIRRDVSVFRSSGCNTSVRWAICRQSTARLPTSQAISGPSERRL